MSYQPKPKFKKVKLKKASIYIEIDAKCKKHTPDPRLDKLDRIEKEGIEVALKTNWDQNIQNITLRRGVNQSLINYTNYTHFD